MRALPSVTGKVAVLDRADVDTDQIIPKQFLKRIERSGYGEFLFFDWMKEPGFVLAQPENREARILIAGRNFGCGSSSSGSGGQPSSSRSRCCGPLSTTARPRSRERIPATKNCASTAAAARNGTSGGSHACKPGLAR